MRHDQEGQKHYAARKRLRAYFNTRVAGERRRLEYLRLKALLVSKGINKRYAWMAAAYPFQPLNGDDHEFRSFPEYEEIARDWKNGKYEKLTEQLPQFAILPRSNGALNHNIIDPATITPAAEEYVEDMRNAPSRRQRTWAQIAKKVGKRKSDEATDARWVMENYHTDLVDIDVDDIPSRSALAMLDYAKTNFSEFMRAVYVKLMPDRKSIEVGSGRVDDGKSLELLDRFDASFDFDEDDDDPVVAFDVENQDIDDDIDDDDDPEPEELQ